MTTWTPKLAAQRSRRKLRALDQRADELILGIAREWGDIDQYVINCCDELLASIEAGIDAVREAIEAHLEEHDE